MQDLFFWVLAHGDKFLMWALVFIGGLVSMVILKQLKSGTVRDIVSRALTEVGDAVLAVTQTYVDEIKLASADGKLTDEEKAHAKAKAVALIKSNIGLEGIKKLARIIGVDVDGWLGTKVEAAVAVLKAKTGTLLATATTTTAQAGEISVTETKTTVPANPQ